MLTQTSSPTRDFYFSPLQFWLLLCAGSLLALSFVSSVMFIREYQDKIYPGVVIDSVSVGGLTSAQAKNNLEQQPPLPEYQIQLTVDSIEISSTSAELNLQKNIDRSIQNALSYGKNGSPWVRARQILSLQVAPYSITSEWELDQGSLQTMISHLKQLVDSPSEEPAATLKTSGSVQTLRILPGKVGRSLDIETTFQTLVSAPVGRDLEVEATVASVGATLTTQEIEQATSRAQQLVGRSLVATGPQLNIRVNDVELVSLLALPAGYSDSTINQLITTWKESVDRPPQDADFTYDPTTLKVTTFKPQRDGLVLDETQVKQRLISSLVQLETSSADQITENLELPLAATAPTKSLASTNDLGINELIGFGESEYDHSIPNRIHNVALTADRLNLTILKPGEEFSFNKALGEVSAATGFKQAYVIKDGQTILGDGGGVCQVSTTIFRSVLNAGLPVTKRKAHSYRVSYYELNSKPGIDATVYSGDVDLRFVNDTGHHVLLSITADSQDLYMKVEVYGTSDGRTTEIIDHVTWDARPAPAPVFVTDPSLALGQKRQIDFAASGIRAKFTNVVKNKDGEEIRRDTYASNYVPWAAKYLVGM